VTAFLAVIGRDLRLAAKNEGEVLTLVLFFVSVGVIVPFAIGPDSETLRRLAPAIVWIAAFLSMLLGLDRLFRPDFEDGTLTLFRHARLPLPAIVGGKLIAHWLLTALPLVLATPILALLLSADLETFWRVVLSLLLGTPGLAALGAIGAGITVTLRRGGLIAPVLITPLAIPILIFGVATIAPPAGAAGSASAAGLFLAAISLLLCAITPFACALAITAGED